ncbi:hypothetical protein ACIA8G_21830 [Lentzea sp. NPDC051213]|uniref:hypothetical protein n=1 Tax=Lentzea sp. NPDC051213 TaxID=3364126 RepID=UPI00378DD8E3
MSGAPPAIPRRPRTSQLDSTTRVGTRRATSPPDDRAPGNSPARRRVVWALLAGLIVLLGLLVTVGASAQPSTTVPSDPCAGPEPRPIPCALSPTRPPSPTRTPSSSPATTPTTTVANPCVSPQPGQPRPPGCLPPVTSTAPPATTVAPTTAPPTGTTGGDCGITNLTACIGEGIAGLMHTLVGESLNMLLRWVGSSLLSTPTLDQLPRIGELWESSRLFAVAAYTLIVLIAGIIVMAHESVQTRYALREMAPRLVVGFVAANLSLLLGDKAIRFANAASLALLGNGLDPQTAGQAISEMFVSIVMNSLVTGGLFAGVLSIVLTVLLVALLVGYIVRVALTVILLAGAPVAIMLHGLPQTEGVAHWFWRAGAGVLGIQVGQSLALICALKVFLQPGGFHFFGTTPDGMVNLIVTIALIWILVKIPSWISQRVQLTSGGRRSFVGGLVRAFVMGKAMGLLGGRGFGGHTAAAAGAGGGAGRGQRGTVRTGEPPWPAPIREWGGTAGIYSPEAVGRRLREQQALERSRVGGRVLPVAPQFLQPSPQTPTHEIATRRTPGRPAMPEFRAALPEPPTPRPGTRSVSVATGSVTPVFRPPAARTSAARSVASRPVPGVPTHLQFRPATPEAPVRPVRATVPPPVPAEVFQPATPDPAGRRVRSHTPAPLLFQPPRPGHPQRPRGDTS